MGTGSQLERLAPLVLRPARDAGTQRGPVLKERVPCGSKALLVGYGITVKDQVLFAPIVLPAASATPFAPPTTVTV
jgi:hypothetical protein